MGPLQQKQSIVRTDFWYYPLIYAFSWFSFSLLGTNTETTGNRALSTGRDKSKGKDPSLQNFCKIKVKAIFQSFVWIIIDESSLPFLHSLQSTLKKWRFISKMTIYFNIICIFATGGSTQTWSHFSSRMFSAWHEKITYFRNHYAVYL